MKIIMHTKICDIIAIANKHVEMLEFANKYEASLSFSHQRCKSPVYLLVIGIKWNLVEPYRAKWFVIVTWQLNHDNSNANEDWWLWLSISVICNAYLFSIVCNLTIKLKNIFMSKLCMIKWTFNDIQSMCTNEVVALKIIRGLCQMWNGEKVL